MSSSNHILHIIDTLQPHGAQRLVQGILQAESTYTQYVIGLAQKKGDISFPNQVEMPSFHKYNLISPLLEIKKTIKQYNISVIHCHLFKSQIIGWLLKKIWFSDITLIFHEHGRICAVEKSAIEWKLYRLFMHHSQKQVNTYIAISQYVQQSLIDESRIDPSSISIIRNAIGDNFFSTPRTSYPKKPRIGFAARFIERKGWRTFLEAAQLLKKQGWNAEFVLAGYGPDQEKIAAYISNHDLSDIVHIDGTVIDMKSWYDLLTAFVTTPTWEPLGLTHIEAMARGIPVIASNVSALNEVIVHNTNGLLIAPLDPKALSSAILEIHSNEKTAERVTTEGANRALDFTYQLYMTQLESLYETQYEE